MPAKNKHIALLLIGLLWTALAFGIEGRPKMRRACLNRLDSSLDLLWFKPKDNCGSFTHFSVYARDNNLASFQLIYYGTSYVSNNIQFKVPNLKNWEFYIVYAKLCNGTDSTFSDTILVDNTEPLNSELDSVSVDLLTQKTIIGWKNNLSPDVAGYFIYHVTGTNSVIYNTKSTTYLDNNISRDPTTAALQYSVAAYDSCNNTSLISIPHKTIWAQCSLDLCAKKITLTWSNYVGWTVDHYEIYVKTNSGNFVLAGSVVANINSFTYNFNKFGDNYCFLVRAFKSGEAVSSSSNLVCISSSAIVATKNSYVAKASVQNNAIELVLITNTNTSLKKLNIYKGENNQTPTLWQSINHSGGILSLIDANVNVHSKNYTYYFTTEGPCNLIFDTSQKAKTILLNVLMASPGDQSLNWNTYNDFIKGTSGQQILLSNTPNFNNSSPWNILLNASNSLTTHQDYTSFSVQQDRICYCIRAIENNSFNPYNRKDSSYSNIECVTADPIVFFPDAIQINGYNTTFYPKGIFIDYDKSSLEIFNRWGQSIFKTNDVKTGWDGTCNGEFVVSDVYAYRSTIVGLNGKILTFDGTITVLK